MGKKLALLIVGAIIVIGGIAMIASKSHNKPDMSNMNMASSSSSQAVSTAKVDIKDYQYSPATIKVKVGETVTWTNQDAVHHTITMENNADGPKSDEFSQGQSYSYTFKTAGTYKYFCQVHPNMHGTVIVQ